jgi:hypothetical protein
MLLGGKTVFPITLGNGPPLTGHDPVNGGNGWGEVAAAGVISGAGKASGEGASRGFRRTALSRSVGASCG